MLIYNRKVLRPLQRALRKSQTDAERKIWNIVRKKQIKGQKFFRQYSVGNYILDFYCPQIKLALEIDGGQHNKNVNIKKDGERSRFLKSFGIKVVRFWNNDVLKNTEGVYEEIDKKIIELLPTSSLEKRRGNNS
jgi:very-short-patch-repair endonuclease